jgi:hypothetical protein
LGGSRKTRERPEIANGAIEKILVSKKDDAEERASAVKKKTSPGLVSGFSDFYSSFARHLTGWSL